MGMGSARATNQCTTQNQQQRVGNNNKTTNKNGMKAEEITNTNMGKVKYTGMALVGEKSKQNATAMQNAKTANKTNMRRNKKEQNGVK